MGEDEYGFGDVADLGVETLSLLIPSSSAVYLVVVEKLEVIVVRPGFTDLFT